jgi:hypothetical protein
MTETMAPATDLAAILGTMDEDAAVFERNGEHGRAAALRARASEIRAAASDYITWLTEEEAMLRSGESRTRVKSLALRYVAAGHARIVGRRFQVRACIVPRRVG